MHEQPQLWKNWYVASAVGLLLLLGAVVATNSPQHVTEPTEAVLSAPKSAEKPTETVRDVPSSATAVTKPAPVASKDAATRDAVRVAQMNDLAVAINEYAKAHGTTYPPGKGVGLTGKLLCTNGWLEVCGTGNPVSRLTAKDILPPPAAAGTACSAAQISYSYTATAWNTWYELRFCLEAGTDKLARGTHVLTPKGFDAKMPTTPDADGDGLNDGREALLGTNPRVADTDGDSVADGAEVTAGTDPLTNAQSGKKSVAP